MSEAKAVGFNFTVIGLLDPETKDQFQLSGDAPAGATAEELQGLMATVRKAVWLERQQIDQRMLLKSHVFIDAIEQRTAEFRAAGRPVDEENVADQVKAANAIIVRQQAKVDAQAAVIAAELPPAEG